MKENLRVRVGAVVLALATLAAVIFAWLNFVQRSRYDQVDDGVAWSDGPKGIEAWKVAPDSPAAVAGIRPGDILLSINDAAVPSAAHVARRLYRAGLWTQLRYKLSRNDEEFETRLITTPAQKPLRVENYLRVVGLLYLFISMCIFTYFVWARSFCIRFNTAASSIRLISKYIGRALPRDCSLRHCYCTLPWCSRIATKATASPF